MSTVDVSDVDDVFKEFFATYPNIRKDVVLKGVKGVRSRSVTIVLMSCGIGHKRCWQTRMFKDMLTQQIK